MECSCTSTNAAAVRDAVRAMTKSLRVRAPTARIEGFEVEAEVRGGKEVLIGLQRDPGFGPIVVFGLGGIYVEVLRDVTFRLAPVRPLSARHMIESVKAFPLLQGVRGEPPSDLDALAEAIERVSQLAVELPEVAELDLNPLIVRGVGAGGRRGRRTGRARSSFHTGTVRFSRSIRNRVAAKASLRWPHAAPTITATSPTGTRPTRCQATVRPAPNRRRASTSSARRAARAGRCALRRRARGPAPRGSGSALTRPAKRTTPPSVGSSSSRNAAARESGRGLKRTDIASLPRTAGGSPAPNSAARAR